MNVFIDNRIVSMIPWPGEGRWWGKVLLSGLFIRQAVNTVRRPLKVFSEKEANEARKAYLLKFPGRDEQIQKGSKGQWEFERSSGFDGFRCQACATWIYNDQIKQCECD